MALAASHAEVFGWLFVPASISFQPYGPLENFFRIFNEVDEGQFELPGTPSVRSSA